MMEVGNGKGRDALIKLLHGYYWGRLDMMNWTKIDDENLINRLLENNA